MNIKTVSVPDQAGAFGVLTLAFSVDPMARWSLTDPATYLATFSSITKAFAGSAFEKGAAYIADGFTGAALWLPPDTKSDEESLKRLSDENTDGGIKRICREFLSKWKNFIPPNRTGICR